MPALKYVDKTNKKTGKKSTYVYIIENQTVVDPETGKKKENKVHLQSLGILGRDVSKSQAKIALSKYFASSQPIKIDITFGEVSNEFSSYLKTQVGSSIKKRTFESFEYGINFTKTLFNEKIAKLDFYKIEEFKSSLPKNLSNRTVNIILMQLNKVLRYAERKGYISTLPHIQKQVEFKKETKRLSKQEIQKLLSASKGNVQLYLYIMVFTGMRPYELLTLRWEDIDFDQKIIAVKSENRLKKGRKIPIHNVLYKLLKKNRKETGPVSPYRTRFGAHGAVQKLGKELNIEVSPYTLRKTFASLMAEKEVSPFILAKMLGHSSISTTYKYYVEIEHLKLKKELDKHPLNDIKF